jgi:carboxypeptidase C (cathepsin A)
MKFVRILTCAALAASMTFSAAAADAPKAVNPLANVPADSITHHTMSLHGASLTYTARAGTIVIRNDDDKPQATMFYTAFSLDGANLRTRPVTFFYNGGPGSATLWLRQGSFGPKRVLIGNGVTTAPPPYRMVDNQYTLLDKSDLVFVDMPATGFGRILPGGDPKSIFGSDNDTKAFGQFVQRYLTNFHRWNSPKVLFGESYGTPRTAMLVDYLQNAGVGINGVVLQSSIINYWLASSDTYAGSSTNDWQYVFDVPTMAATAWYYHAVANRPASLPAYMKQIQAWDMGPYRDALAQGAWLPKTQYDSIVSQLHDRIGLSEQYIRDANLRIDSARFRAELTRERGLELGPYDARYSVYMSGNRTEDQPQIGADDASIDAPFISTTNEYLREELGYRTNLQYMQSAGAAIVAAGGWDFSHDGSQTLNTAPDLAEAMTINPSLRVFSANGWYDSVTPFQTTVYTLNHLGIDPHLQGHITYGFYPSGHMIYLNTAALAQWRSDLGRWYDSLLRGK